jgi:MFS family permease
MRAWWLLVVMTLAQAGATLDQQGLGALAPSFVAELHLDHASVGAIFGAIYLGSTLFTAPSGLVVDALGERRVVLWSGIAMGLAIACAAAIPDRTWLTVWLFVFGVAYASSSPAGGRAILRWFRANRGLAMGVRQAGAPLGGTVGALVLPLVAYHFGGYRAALLVGAVLCAASAIVAGALYRETGTTKPFSLATLPQLGRGMLAFARQRRAICVSAASFLIASGQYTAVAFVALALLRSGVPAPLATGALGIMQGTGLVARPIWGIVSDRVFRGERCVPFALLCVLGAFSLWALAQIGPGVPAALVVVVAIGLGASTIGFTGLLNTLLAEMGGPDAAGSAMGVGLTFTYAAGFVTPPIFGAIVDHAGFSRAWTLLAAMLVLGAVLAFAARTPHPRAAPSRAPAEATSPHPQ